MKGIIASDGIAIGYAHLIKEKTFDLVEGSSLTSDEEFTRFETAKIKALEDLEILKEKTLKSVGESEAEVFEAHKQLLMDPVMAKEIDAGIQDGKTSEFAFSQTIDKYIDMFQALDNDYMRERALDLKDIKSRMLSIFLGEASFVDDLKDQSIIVTYDLTPSETVNLDRKRTIGFITEIGGETSHSAIIARTLNIPAVVGLGREITRINHGDLLILDGTSGEIFINPDQDLCQAYEKKQAKHNEAQELLKEYLNKPSVTLDGKAIEVAANIASVDDVDAVVDVTADGIGLFRSEFLYMNRDNLPTEEEQFQAYKAVLEKMQGKPVTIRTMDIGGDKQLDYLNLQEEMNPFLGYRAIRICLQEPEIFKSQLRALLRASTYGNLRIMFPMISCLEELLEAKNYLKSCEQDLKDQGVHVSDYQVGIMIEIPSAGLVADILAEEVDFFSIGTNDLIQYTSAVDRMNNKISELYSPYHPAFLRFLKSIVEAGHSKGIEVGMCGNVAGYPQFIPYLLNIGLDELSMSPNMVLKARSIVNTHKKGSVEQVLACKTKKEVELLLN